MDDRAGQDRRGLSPGIWEELFVRGGKPPRKGNKMNKQEANKAKQPVVEMYFEAMKNHCHNNLCTGCPFYDMCDIALGKGFINFTDLTSAQITALEPYALAWAESEGMK